MSKVTRRTRSAVCQLLAVGNASHMAMVLQDPLPPFPASMVDGYAVVAADGPGQVSRGLCVRVAVLGSRVLPSLLPCVSTISWARAWLGRR